MTKLQVAALMLVTKDVFHKRFFSSFLEAHLTCWNVIQLGRAFFQLKYSFAWFLSEYCRAVVGILMLSSAREWLSQLELLLLAMLVKPFRTRLLASSTMLLFET